jgi:hypothetical protein
MSSILTFSQIIQMNSGRVSVHFAVADSAQFVVASFKSESANSANLSLFATKSVSQVIFTIADLFHSFLIKILHSQVSLSILD